ncbi:MAG TPA: M48 family metalloprotease [Bryobacterales bacterium]|nr:M48 family metalloprotease [Bryobacterales bacterium]
MKKIVAVVLSALLAGTQQAAVIPQTTPLAELVNRSYLDLLEVAPSARVSEKEADDFKKQLDKEKEAEQKRLEQQEKELKRQAEEARKQLAALSKAASRDTDAMTEQRRQLHCRILKLEGELHQKQTERQNGVPVAFANKAAKLDLIQQWPAKRKEIEQTLAAGKARQRRYGDIEDIGVRKISEGQEKDIKAGEEAVRDLKMYGLMPPEMEDKQIQEYVRRLAEAVAASSDLTVPARATVLESKEINAFALPGGFLFVNTGLLEKAETESELAGVIAHELAHVAARHGARMMKRATIANIIYQVANVAAVIFTGGVAGIGTYYALQYGFFGLGMALNLALLGVNREYEAEADQLGAQYAWRSGYDPRGFITFFDKMASEKGYVKSASFFRTHPPFFERIVSTFSEIEYLPKQEQLKVDSKEFHQIKERLRQLPAKEKQEQRKKPSLRRLPECDEEPNPASGASGSEDFFAGRGTGCKASEAFSSRSFQAVFVQ